MSNRAGPTLSDAMLRAALTEDPTATSVDRLAFDLGRALRSTRQRRAGRLSWPSSPRLSEFLPSSPIDRVQMLVGVGLLGLLILLSLALLPILSGSLRRLPSPLGVAQAGLIAFDANGRIVLANADGSGQRSVTPAGVNAQRPTWSPDGTRIAYWSVASLSSLTVMQADGSHPTVVADGVLQSWIDGGAISWSPDSTRLAFAAEVDSVSQIFVARADRPSAVRIGNPALDAVHPAWSPDGQMIAFAGKVSRVGPNKVRRGLYVMHANGSGVRRLGTVWGNDIMAAWSPDGSSLAVTSPDLRSTCVGSVWVVRADGTSERLLAGDLSWDYFAPSWSPDGTRIAFLRTPSSCVGGVGLVVANADGSRARVVLASGLYAPTGLWSAVWSPDGTRLLGDVPSADGSHAAGLIQIAVGSGTPTIRTIAGLSGENGDWQRLAP